VDDGDFKLFKFYYTLHTSVHSLPSALKDGIPSLSLWMVFVGFCRAAPEIDRHNTQNETCWWRD